MCVRENGCVTVEGGGRDLAWLLYLAICLHPRPFPREEGRPLSSSAVWRYIS